jgi:putative Holliday junction resolvase
VAAEREAAGLVVGLPLNMDGSSKPEGEAARAFAANLTAALGGLPVYLQDERLTTFVVEDAIEEGRLPRPKRPGDPIDHYAAAVILEDCLAALARDRRVAFPFASISQCRRRMASGQRLRRAARRGRPKGRASK